MQAVSSLFGGAKPDNSAQQRQAEQIAAQEKQAAADKKSLQEKQNATLNATRARRAGYRSLISMGETGVSGAGTETRTTLG